MAFPPIGILAYPHAAYPNVREERIVGVGRGGPLVDGPHFFGGYLCMLASVPILTHYSRPIVGLARAFVQRLDFQIGSLPS
jgi:hypothetical protein